MDQRVQELCSGFAIHLARFGESDVFSGPSWYFHRKTLDLRARHASLRTLLDDDQYFDALYATLTAWGLHRMGPGSTKLRELAEIRDSVRESVEQLERLTTWNIATVGEERHAGIVDTLWAVIARLRVSVAKARIVANSKLLHHILPDLVPPIDREYTFRFFYERTMLSIDEERAFREMFARVLRIGQSSRLTIEATAKSGWNTCPTKVVDNAIVGFILSRRASVPPNDETQRTRAAQATEPRR